jgi:flagellar biogenesis protein FliO
METASQALAVVAVLGLLAGALWFLRSRGLARFGPASLRRRGRLASVERLPLTPQHSLHLVRFGQKAILLAVSPSGCTLVETAPWQSVQEIEPPERGGGAA